jgi:amidase
MVDPIYASAMSIARAIRSREISSETVVQEHLQRIAEVNPSLNAVVQVTRGSAPGLADGVLG